MQGVSTASGSGPPAKPPRSVRTVRDMLGALAVLGVIVLAVGGLTRGCSFAPTGPAVDPSAGPTVDAPAQLRVLAGSTAFALRVPAVPADWRANAVGVVRVAPGGERSVRTGFVLPSGRYLRVAQSDAPEQALVAAEAKGPPMASGPVEAAGRTWVVYDDGTREPLRVADVDGVRLSITGSGTEADFRTLAEATLRGAVLPAGA